MVLLGGQFKSATHGQFKSAQGGQFDRILHINVKIKKTFFMSFVCFSELIIATYPHSRYLQ